MITKEMVRRVAKNARMNVDDAEIEIFTKEFNDIISAFDIIKGVKTDGVTPSFQPFEIKNIMRLDWPRPSLSQAQALKNAEQKEGKCFKGPRAV